jgi:hypothetical protein
LQIEFEYGLTVQIFKTSRVNRRKISEEKCAVLMHCDPS